MTWLLSPARAPSRAQTRSGALSLFFVNPVPRSHQRSHRFGSALDSVANFGRDRKLHRPHEIAPAKHAPEIGKVRQRCPAGRALPHRLAEKPAQRAFDRDHPDRMATENRLGEHRDAVRGHVDLVALAKEHGEAREFVDHDFALAGEQAIEQAAGRGGGARADGCDQGPARRLAPKRGDRLAERRMVELPVARRAADRDQPPRCRVLVQPAPLGDGRLSRLGGIADREGQLQQVRLRLAGILRSRDLQVEIVELRSRVADVHEPRAAAGLLPDVPRHGDAAITDPDHQVGPGRRDQRSARGCNRGQPATEPRQPPQLVVTDLPGFPGIAERFGEGDELVVVPRAIAHQQPHPGRLRGCEPRLLRSKGEGAARHGRPVSAGLHCWGRAAGAGRPTSSRTWRWRRAAGRGRRGRRDGR